MKVVDDLGRPWYVSRRWIAWRPRTADDWVPKGGDKPVPESDDEAPTGLRRVLYWLSLLGLFLLEPLSRTLDVVLVLVERLLLALTLPFAVAGRVLFRRSWDVEVRHGLSRVWETPAGGWAASRELISTQAELLRRGEHPAQELVEPPHRAKNVGPGGRRARRDRRAGD